MKRGAWCVRLHPASCFLPHASCFLPHASCCLLRCLRISYITIDPATAAFSESTWRRMGTHNPRPAYSSKLLIDPSDESRLRETGSGVANPGAAPREAAGSAPKL